jgi:hypothetical protein
MTVAFGTRPDSQSPLARKIEAAVGARKAPLWSVGASREALRRRYAREARKALRLWRKGMTIRGRRPWLERRYALKREAHG